MQGQGARLDPRRGAATLGGRSLGSPRGRQPSPGQTRPLPESFGVTSDVR